MNKTGCLSRLDTVTPQSGLQAGVRFGAETPPGGALAGAPDKQEGSLCTVDVGCAGKGTLGIGQSTYPSPRCADALPPSLVLSTHLPRLFEASPCPGDGRVLMTWAVSWCFLAAVGRSHDSDPVDSPRGRLALTLHGPRPQRMLDVRSQALAEVRRRTPRADCSYSPLKGDLWPEPG